MTTGFMRCLKLRGPRIPCSQESKNKKLRPTFTSQTIDKNDT